MLDPVANTLDLRAPSTRRAKRVCAAMKASGVGISDLGYFDNLLHHDRVTREKKRDFLLKVLDAAVLLGVNAVCGFVGRNQQHSMDENLVDFEEHFVPILKAVKERGLTYRVEQCPMPGWTTGDNWHNNIAYTPGAWIALHRICERTASAISSGSTTTPRTRFSWGRTRARSSVPQGQRLRLPDWRPREGPGRRREGRRGVGLRRQTMERGDWIDGKPSAKPADQLNAWKKQVVLCEHELPGTARHDPLAICRTARWTGSITSSPRASCCRSTSQHASRRRARVPRGAHQDRERLKPILQGSIAFVRRIDEAAACMFALQHEVLKAQDIPIQGVGRQPYRT